MRRSETAAKVAVDITHTAGRAGMAKTLDDDPHRHAGGATRACRPISEMMTAPEPGTRKVVIERRATAAPEFNDQLALGTTRDVGAGYWRGSKELPEWRDQQSVYSGRARILLSMLTFRPIFRPRPKVHLIPLSAALPVVARCQIWTKATGRASFRAPHFQWSGPAVQRKPVRMLLSNWHSTAKSRVKAPSGGMSLLIPSTWATIVVRPVADASLLLISMVALGKARCIISAQRPARPTSRVTPQPLPRQQTRQRTLVAEPGWCIGMIVLGARAIIKHPVMGLI